jgi:hypothetical protein
MRMNAGHVCRAGTRDDEFGREASGLARQEIEIAPASERNDPETIFKMGDNFEGLRSNRSCRAKDGDTDA